MAVQINDQKLEERVLEADKHVCILFFAYDSKICEHQLPAFDDVAEQLRDRMEFYKINTIENPKITKQLEVKDVPTILIYHDGDEIARYDDMYSSASLMTRFTAVLNKKK